MENFKIAVPATAIIELKKRLIETRWPDEVEDSGWEYGANLGYMKELCRYWQQGFDWLKQENALNQLHHFRTDVDGVGIHFIHEKGKGSKSWPLLLIHGWPDSFYRFFKLIPLLTKPDENGFAFDVIVPSIPGFGFSDRPNNKGMNTQEVAKLFAKLLTEQLGYQKFAIHGGDWGSSITEQLALNFADNVSGIHLTDIPYTHIFTVKAKDLSDEEKKYIEAGQKWQTTEGGYAILQATKPQTLAYALNDSPAGLAAWIVEKFNTWSDNGGDIGNSFSKDELLTNISIYWFTQTAGSSMRIYYENMHKPANPPANKVTVPTSVSIFPKDLIPTPENYGRRFFNIQNWHIMDKGGHFAALEVPELLAKEIWSSLSY